eukprot:5931666-Pleurochrysis_carterae.AAC.1
MPFFAVPSLCRPGSTTCSKLNISRELLFIGEPKPEADDASKCSPTLKMHHRENLQKAVRQSSDFHRLRTH